MDEAMDMESFLVELVDMLEVLICNSKREMDLERPVSFWPQVIEQLDAVGWDKVLQLNKDLSQVQIGLLDASQRNHILTIDFPPGYPAVPLAPRPLEIPKTESGDALNSLEHLAPSVTASQISGGHSTEIVDIVQQAESKLKLFQEFWDVMQDIDERTWVIDPEHPTRMDCMRRCALGNHCSVQMTIDPRNPRILPIIRLFGPTSAVEALRTKLHQNTGLWDSSELVCDNMQILLELDNGFPTPGNASKDELNIECGICYSYRFEGQIPNQLCSHQKCQQPFHRACLYEFHGHDATGRDFEA
ncbi:hypothetical protein BGW38_002927 [Lunasporangiospora selenospora]|uniref:E3 ubiquitin-protein ligase FANCL n=1 Tax=Lunasporangiospora selenospora TaxID=979761 RepID=A0A9P6G1J7_9FUNG|nr:hypothetical protein BGW38_002927 [Lunasporangiospora selenospora]